MADYHTPLVHLFHLSFPSAWHQNSGNKYEVSGDIRKHRVEWFPKTSSPCGCFYGVSGVSEYVFEELVYRPTVYRNCFPMVFHRRSHKAPYQRQTLRLVRCWVKCNRCGYRHFVGNINMNGDPCGSDID